MTMDVEMKIQLDLHAWELLLATPSGSKSRRTSGDPV
jgi:hypothetical protein